VLDWYAVCGQDREVANETLCVSIVTRKDAKRLQDYMHENLADGLAMLNPDFARKPDEYLIWNTETGRYDFDVEKFDAGVHRD
jgi:hypothetical protein